MDFLEWTYLGNTLQRWLVGLLITLTALAALRILRTLLHRRFSAVVRRIPGDWDELVTLLSRRTNSFLLAIFSTYAGSLALTLPGKVPVWIGTLAFIALLIQIALWADAIIPFWVTRYQRRQIEEDAARVTTVRALSFVVRLILFSIVALLALDNIPGVEVTTLIASLGVGGIAVALAVQGLLADLFASLSISLDKPFVIGDFIIVDTYLGTVEHIGLKTTRIRSLSGEQLIFSNNDLLSSRIRNYKRMAERRIVFSFGVIYQTPHEKLREIPSIVQQIVEPLELTRFDRAHFKEYGDFSLNFEVVYYVLDPDYRLYMDIQQAINLAIYEAFEEQGIEFAYPTQTLYVSDGRAPLEKAPSFPPSSA
ncbi:mechanosensitive ion channel protein MscS [candidate division TA06 bacterium DG_24]|uniref:Mechanosensitive ion channel protein MscS n=3 Tax=Bacteria division TA06 TaxID=1156500 RepID=A0A0S8JRC6_UNCT6|nr:MAG: mechanosensitive ion channel protein MscS [candidate division TA06 bacterium DG_24]KPK69427.1 MAG: mechanosensitive ion channel protein MscS [candidate division TA06 bacterium SM23_40]KPL11388.1 MAG: mechanosensitive ion channel protein MscS [candidate division TA06 bacterium SM1_40]